MINWLAVFGFLMLYLPCYVAFLLLSRRFAKLERLIKRAIASFDAAANDFLDGGLEIVEVPGDEI